MRKQSREMSAEFALDVFSKAPYVTLAFQKPDGNPYSLPLSVVVASDGVLYFHCAQQGLKLDCIGFNEHVSLSAVTRCQPVVGPKDQSFTLEYRSAVAFGTACRVSDPAEKKRALRLICERFLPEHMTHFEEAVARSISRVEVVRISLEKAPTGKRKEYDRDGEELKYQREK